MTKFNREDTHEGKKLLASRTSTASFQFLDWRCYIEPVEMLLKSTYHFD